MSNILYTIKARFVKIETIGPVPEGDRKNYHFIAEIIGESLNGTLSGIDYSLTVNNQVQAHIHEVLTTEQGEKISFERTGTSIEQENPDMVVITGQGQARTAIKHLSWLNTARITWKAQIPRQGLEFSAEIYQE